MDHLPMKNLLAFLLGWLIAAVFMIPQARAAITVSPMVSGYTASSGRFASGASGFGMTAANDGYIAQSITNVGGRSVTMPATMRMAANAGQIAKNAMRLSPAGIVGTLAAGWLLGQGIEYLNDQWTHEDPNYTPGTYPYGYTWGHTRSEMSCYRYGSGCDELTTLQQLSAGYCASSGCSMTGYTFVDTYTIAERDYDIAYSWPSGQNAVVRQRIYNTNNTAPVQTAPRVPMTPEDWDALPDPLPVVAPELPYAPYMPDGAPVTAPEYAPQTVPVGDPYTRADGSTAQPMARISPAGNGQVTIDTYDQPVTDPAGNPVADPQPQDTAEPDVDPCDAHPGRLGCSEFGTADPVEVPTTEIPVNPTVTPIGGSGQCPADVVTSVFGITWSYQPVCDFAADIRPLIIGFAWLAFAYIVAGTIRT